MLNPTQTTQIKNLLITLGEFAEEQKKKKLSSSIKFSDARNIVTNIDLDVQSQLVKGLLEITPTWNFLGEESVSIRNNKNDYTWIIDPIDGTLNYVKSVAYYSISLGLVYKNEVVAGFIYAPALSELYYAVKGQGAFLNEIQISVDSATEDITYWCRECEPKTAEEKIAFIAIRDKIEREKTVDARMGSAALSAAYIAANRFNFCYQPTTWIWDIAAATAIVREAGGDIWSLDDSIKTTSEGVFIMNENLYVQNQFIKPIYFKNVFFTQNEKQKEKLKHLL